MASYHYIRTTPQGLRKPVVPFSTPKQAQRYIALALVDNGYAQRSEASAFARQITITGGPRTHLGSGMTYEITKETV